MVQVLLSSEMVKLHIEDVFRRLDRYDHSPEMKRDEASLIWFELFGMQRIIRSFEWLMPQAGSLEAATFHDFFEAKRMLEQALKRAEKSFEEPRPNNSICSS